MIVLAASMTLCGALGAGALAAWLLLTLGDLWARIRPFRRPRWRSALQTFFAEDNERDDANRATSTGQALNVLIYLPGLFAVILAILMRDLLLSPYLVLVGVALTGYLRTRRARRARAALGAQVHSLVVLFRSRYAVGASPFAVLAEIEDDLPPGIVAAAVQRAIHIYGSSGRVNRALAPLRAIDNPYLARLAMLLEAGGTARADTVLSEARRIEDDLKARRRLAGQARASLALLKGTTRFLQAANLTAIAAAVALSTWRDFFTSTLARRGTFLAATLFVLLASLYFDQEIAMQEEQLL